MKEQTFYDILCNINGAEAVFCQEPMKKHTTFRIGETGGLFLPPGDG